MLAHYSLVFHSYLEPKNNTENMISYFEVKRRFGQFLEDHATVRRAGFQDVMTEHLHRIDMFKAALDRKRLGVCAKVTVRIEQELVLTRQAFEAKLEVDNGDSVAMEKIKVRLGRGERTSRWHHRD